jgi:23S rRNA (cytidine1920-2'-O)/16S rRNA (cytidine1409-2'-O)-methyltransferase
MKQRLDKTLLERGLVRTRNQASVLIRLGKVKVNKQLADKAGLFVGEHDIIQVISEERYVGRAGLKLASVARELYVDFSDATVLDVGSSTGGFTDYALQHGAKKVYAVDVGTDQLHPSLRNNHKIELHEKTDIRDFVPTDTIDIVVMDVSFISLREILPHIAKIVGPHTHVVAMLKPQFEAGKAQVNKGVIKNDSVRRQILKEFELWVKRDFVVIDKRDSEVAGTKGNRERFYLLKKVSHTK